MKKAVIGVVVLGLTANASAGPGDKLPLDAYRDPIDRQIAATGKGVPGRPFPCTYEETQNGVTTIVQQPVSVCVKMSPQQRFKGLWRMGQETSIFCPAPATECRYDGRAGKIWLSRTPGGGGRGDLYRVDFIGRRTLYKGSYGDGFADYEVVMDRPIKIELVERAKGWPPDPK